MGFNRETFCSDGASLRTTSHVCWKRSLPAPTKSVDDARPISVDRGAAATWLALKKLHTRASVLMIVAHPDEGEDGATLAYESRGLGARTELMTLDRGEGGANVMSSDLWDALGLVRTEELLQAGRYYGLDGQYFSSMADYGFSKSLKEALDQWGHDRVLAEAVRVVRTVRALSPSSVLSLSAARRMVMGSTRPQA